MGLTYLVFGCVSGCFLLPSSSFLVLGFGILQPQELFDDGIPDLHVVHESFVENVKRLEVFHLNRHQNDYLQRHHRAQPVQCTHFRTKTKLRASVVSAHVGRNKREALTATAYSNVPLGSTRYILIFSFVGLNLKYFGSSGWSMMLSESLTRIYRYGKSSTNILRHRGPSIHTRIASSEICLGLRRRIPGSISRRKFCRFSWFWSNAVKAPDCAADASLCWRNLRSMASACEVAWGSWSGTCEGVPSGTAGAAPVSISWLSASMFASVRGSIVNVAVQK